jgi:hypothetical protein
MIRRPSGLPFACFRPSHPAPPGLEDLCHAALRWTVAGTLAPGRRPVAGTALNTECHGQCARVVSTLIVANAAAPAA